MSKILSVLLTYFQCTYMYVPLHVYILNFFWSSCTPFHTWF